MIGFTVTRSLSALPASAGGVSRPLGSKRVVNTSNTSRWSRLGYPGLTSLKNSSIRSFSTSLALNGRPKKNASPVATQGTHWRLFDHFQLT